MIGPPAVGLAKSTKFDLDRYASPHYWLPEVLKSSENSARSLVEMNIGTFVSNFHAADLEF